MKLPPASVIIFFGIPYSEKNDMLVLGYLLVVLCLLKDREHTVIIYNKK